MYLEQFKTIIPLLLKGQDLEPRLRPCLRITPILNRKQGCLLDGPQGGANPGVVSTDRSHAGVKSLLFDISTTLENFSHQIKYDMGVGDIFYITAWIYRQHAKHGDSISV